jgi:hypothetical protein
MKKITLEDVHAILVGLENLGLLRRMGVRHGRPVWGRVHPDDFRCLACGGDWLGIQRRDCESCAEVVEIERSTAHPRSST